jgi:hypothetical protein
VFSTGYGPISLSIKGSTIGFFTLTISPLSIEALAGSGLRYVPILKSRSEEGTDWRVNIAIADHEKNFWQRILGGHSKFTRRPSSTAYYHHSSNLTKLVRVCTTITTVGLLLIPVVLIFTVSVTRIQLLVMLLISVLLFTCSLSAFTRLKFIEVLIGIAA